MTPKLQTRLRLDQVGRVTIPAVFRKALGLHGGDEVVLLFKEGELRITTQKHLVERAQKIVRKHVKPDISLVDELIADRRQESLKEPNTITGDRRPSLAHRR